MPTLALKLFLGIGSTGLACAIPVDVFYGLKGVSPRFEKEKPASQESQDSDGASDNSLEQISESQGVSCKHDGKEMKIEVLGGEAEGGQQNLELLKSHMDQDGKCSILNDAETTE